jgi:acyl carrier protein
MFMEINDFIANFADQFEDTDLEEITAESKFHDFDEWDSLIALAVLNMTEKKYGKKITFDEMKKCVTVTDLFNLIDKK